VCKNTVTSIVIACYESSLPSVVACPSRGPPNMLLILRFPSFPFDLQSDNPNGEFNVISVFHLKRCCVPQQSYKSRDRYLLKVRVVPGKGNSAIGPMDLGARRQFMIGVGNIHRKNYISGLILFFLFLEGPNLDVL